MWRLLAIALLVPGCFYVEPINERPVAGINVLTGLNPKHGDHVMVESTSQDPNGDPLQVQWQVSACGPRVNGQADCDEPLQLDAHDPIFGFQVPTDRADGTKVSSLAVDLFASDDHGAVGRLISPLPLDVGDAPPTVGLVANGDHFQQRTSYPIGLKIAFFAEKDDSDDGAAAVNLSWTPVPPSGPKPTEPVWTRDPTATTDQVEKYVLVPDQAGVWRVDVVADDGQQGTPTASASVTVVVDEDQPPCLGALAPAVLDHAMQVTGKTRFDVLSVEDDVSAYPTPPAGSTSPIKFHWSITPPEGGPLAPIATDAAGVLIDSGLYTPGAQVDLRVEIEDAVARVLPCDASNPTCSIEGKASCLQRQTWHLTMGAP